MSYYKSMMLGKSKKKVTKKQSKSKVNEVLKSIKEEFGLIKEVGVAQEHKKYIKNIEKAEENMHKHVAKYKNFLMDQGFKNEAKEFSSNYVVMIGKFTHWMKTKWVRMLRKMI